MDLWLIAALVAAIVAVMLLAALQRRHVARVCADRAGLFDFSSELLCGARVEPRGLDFPRLSGRFAGCAVQIEPIVDTLALRVIPVLRLVVAVATPLPGQRWLSVLADENGHEFYSHHRGAVRLRDLDWPRNITVVSDRADDLSRGERELVERAIEIMSADDAFRQVLISARGVRCIVRAGRSDSATYRVTRRADFSGARVAPSLLLNTLTAATEIIDRAHAPRSSALAVTA